MRLMFICVFALNTLSCHCHTIADTNRLIKDKLTDYNKNTRPTNNQSAPTIVSIDIELLYMESLDEVDQKLTIVVIPNLQWTDEQMVWNPADYGGMYQFITESGSFWKPKLTLFNGIGESVRIADDDWQPIRIVFNGGVYFYPREELISVCEVDVTYYPWDIHKCSLSLSPHAFSPRELYLNSTRDTIGTSYYLENGGWSFIGSKIEPVYSDHSSEINYHLIFERKPRYVIVNVILPIILLAFLSNVVFLIPADCGEKISYSITVLLANAVYLTLVGDNLPKISTPMSYFSYYLLAILITSTCISMATIFSLRIYHSDESDPVTGCWAKIARCFKCKRRRNARASSRPQPKETVYQQHHQKGFVCPEGINPAMNGSVYKQGSNSQIHMPNADRRFQTNGRSDRYNKPEVDTLHGNDSDSDTLISWKDVSVAMDRIFFVVFFLIISTSTVVYAVVIATSERAKFT